MPIAAMILFSRYFAAVSSMRGFVNVDDLTDAVTDCAASTVSTVSAFVTVFSTSSPSVVGVGVASSSGVDSESSSPSAAATSATLADRTAGSDTSATPVSSPAKTRIVPSFSLM